MHEDQLSISTPTVAELLATQFPQWAGLAVRPLEAVGTVNAVFRIGAELTARFPLRPGDPAAIEAEFAAEAEAARKLDAYTRFQAPQQLAIGAPGPGCPMPWVVQTWLPGTTATEVDPAGSTAFARDLVELIGRIRTIPTEGRPFSGSGRGGDLKQHDDWMETCLQQSESLQVLDVAPLRALWQRFRELPRTAPDVTNHKDLIPGNLLVHRDAGQIRLAGVLDSGGLGPADPALDLVAAWHLLDGPARAVLRAGLRCDDLDWERGRAWAFEQAMGLVWYYRETNPTMSRMGRRTLHRLTHEKV
ncbi:putative phosphotransferase [Kineosporia sp. NBRC 101677]|uniref:phosphotransferase n=1 Tax=Kineosporia sp. NBRC 101677 TaxID=3032197 RepID=UPI0024A381E4|nr:phosphotransferase [Kineosporia sp. NBRC 101677]GLY14567.1 putative phosphotransferase [Kineosporia sp. NBRC 101677]